jgi:hypothetical protein
MCEDWSSSITGVETLDDNGKEGEKRVGGDERITAMASGCVL